MYMYIQYASKKVNTATLPYLTFTYIPILLPLSTLLLPFHTLLYTCTCTTFALVYCCVGSSACICINVLLFKAHRLPRAVQCRFVAGIYCRGRDLVLHFTCKCSCKRLVNYFQVHVYKLPCPTLPLPFCTLGLPFPTFTTLSYPTLPSVP